MDKVHLRRVGDAYVELWIGGPRQSGRGTRYGLLCGPAEAAKADALLAEAGLRWGNASVTVVDGLERCYVFTRRTRVDLTSGLKAMLARHGSQAAVEVPE